jgi:ATP-dependent DNA helicase RecG
MVEAGLPAPEFEPNGFFSVRFRRSPEFALKKGPEKTRMIARVKTRVKTGVRILDLMRSNPTITREELAGALGLTIKGIDWQIARLKRKGGLRRVGPDVGGRWETVEK